MGGSVEDPELDLSRGDLFIEHGETLLISVGHDHVFSGQGSDLIIARTERVDELKLEQVLVPLHQRFDQALGARLFDFHFGAEAGLEGKAEDRFLPISLEFAELT